MNRIINIQLSINVIINYVSFRLYERINRFLEKVLIYETYFHIFKEIF